MIEILYHRKYSEEDKTPLIILPGLFGSSRNWDSLSRHWAKDYSVYALDLRNHGESFHAPLDRRDRSQEEFHGYEDSVLSIMAEDIEQWRQQIFTTGTELSIELSIQQKEMGTELFPQICLIGHSLGGLVALQYAYSHPEKIQCCIVVDISPMTLLPKQDYSFIPIDLSGFKDRGSVRTAMMNDLKNYIKEKRFLPNVHGNEEKNAENDEENKRSINQLVDFLMLYLVEDGDNGLKWKFNASDLLKLSEALPKAKQLLKKKIAEDWPTALHGKVHFLFGEKSQFWNCQSNESHKEYLQNTFPRSQIHFIANASHWVHITHKKEFILAIDSILALHKEFD